jgi:type VI secretion system secreted protein Hcp
MVTARSSIKLVPLVALLAIAVLWIQPSEPLDAQTNGSPVSTFVRFDDIPGEATERDHIGWSVVESINTSVLRPDSPAVGSSRARSKSITEDLIVVKPLDAAGPYLQLAAWTGRVIPTVDIEIIRNGEVRTVLWEIELRNVLVTSYSMGTTGQDDLTPNSLPLVATSMQPTEQITLDFEQATVRYYELTDDGTEGSEHEVEYNIVAGR